MTGHARWNAFRGNSNADSDKLFTTTRSYMIQKKTGVSVFLENTINDCDFKIKGSWSQKRCAIYVGDSSTIIAQVYFFRVIIGYVWFAGMEWICENLDFKSIPLSRLVCEIIRI